MPTANTTTNPILPVGDDTVTVQRAIARCAAAFSESQLVFGHGTDNAWDEATWLVLHVTQLPDDQDSLPLLLTSPQSQRVSNLARRRIQERVPLAYLLGEAWFAGLPFYLEPGVIVPRSPLAELLLQGVAPWLTQAPKRVLDMCCGSGCLGILAAKTFPQSQVLLVDIDAQALAVAQANVARHELQGQVQVVQSDLYNHIAAEAAWDLIICNPPYVDAADMGSLPAEFQAEPQLALAGGADGLAVMAPFLRHTFAAAHSRLNPGGVLLGEVGNSSAALQAAFIGWPFIWPDLERGGEGVFVLDQSPGA